MGVLTVALFSSLLAEEPISSLNFLTRLLVGAFGLSILIVWWNPNRTRVLLIACAYVLGNVISVGYAVGSGQVARDGRRAGLAEHPNVYGLTAMLAVTIIPFIVTQFPRSWRWLPAGAGVVCLYGVYSSGSRAALAVLIGVAVILPVLARSVTAALALLTALATFLVFSSQLLGETSTGNALGRLLGAGSADLSDLAREQLLEEAIDRFWNSPIYGNGLAGIIEAHVIYVQIAAALGVIGLAFYLMVLWSTVHPITVLTPPYSLLAVPALSYVVLGFVTPVLWDRYIWMVTSLALLAPRLAAAAATPEVEEVPVGGTHRKSGVVMRPLERVRQADHDVERRQAGRPDADPVRQRFQGPGRHRLATHGGAALRLRTAAHATRCSLRRESRLPSWLGRTPSRNTDRGEGRAPGSCRSDQDIARIWLVFSRDVVVRL